MGHDGNFVDDQFRADLCDAGFTIIKDELRKYSWDFTDEQSMIEFIRLMFWLDKLPAMKFEMVSKNILA